MYFKATVTDNGVRIQATRNIKDAMMAVTMICRDVNEIEEYSESDRFVFRKFVAEELAKLAFSDVDGLAEEEKRLKELCENAMARSKAGKNLRKLIKELGDFLDEVDEDEDET